MKKIVILLTAIAMIGCIRKNESTNLTITIETPSNTDTIDFNKKMMSDIFYRCNSILYISIDSSEIDNADCMANSDKYSIYMVIDSTQMPSCFDIDDSQRCFFDNDFINSIITDKLYFVCGNSRGIIYGADSIRLRQDNSYAVYKPDSILTTTPRSSYTYTADSMAFRIEGSFVTYGVYAEKIVIPHTTTETTETTETTQQNRTIETILYGFSGTIIISEPQ